MSENKFRSPPEHRAWIFARKINKAFQELVDDNSSYDCLTGTPTIKYQPAFQHLFEVQNKNMNNPPFVLPYFTSRITR